MRRTILLFSTFLLLVIGCEHDSYDEYVYRVPQHIDDGLDTGALTEVNMDSLLIIQAVENISRERYKEIHAVLVFKDSKLIIEEYFKGHEFKHDAPNYHGETVNWDQTRLHRVMSVTKSITSACIGIAVDKGFIKSVRQSIFDYFPDHRYLGAHGKDKITIEHLLTMTPGWQGNEWLVPYSNPKNDIIMTYWAEDPINFILNKPLIFEPGAMFQYYGGANFILGEIIRNATKINLDEFSGKYLFEPLGIAPYYWFQLNKGVIDGAGGLKITPRDMVKIGVMFLNKGVWDGKKIISEQWVEKSAVSFPGNHWLNNWDDHWGLKGYSYSWWTHQFVNSGKRIDMFYAAGWGGQYIMVIPDLKMVVVFTGGNYATYRPSFEILKRYILPAVQ